MGRIREYEGESIVVRYDVRRCIHARECVRGLPDVFDARRRPWVDAAAASADRIAETVCRCPTGALSYERADGGPAEPVPDSNTITVSENGPLYVRGDVELTLPDGEVRRETRMALCRCGKSKNKPYCDDTHYEIGFTAAASLGDCKLREEEVEEGTDPQSRLRLSFSPGRSLKVLGPVTIVGGDLEPHEGSRGSLCRCGGSENKPYCDGTHRHIEFEAE